MSIKRQVDILEAVRQKGSYSISDLADRLAVSTETVRRNVQPLIDQGSLIRFHGGVMVSKEMSEEPPFQRRLKVNATAKAAVAQIVRDVIRDGDSLILDNGSSGVYVAEALARHSNLIVVTNSAEISVRLATRNGNRVFMAGGELNSEDASAFGSSAVEFLKQFEVKYAFLSVSGIRDSGDIAVFNLVEAEFARAAMRQARETWVLADSSKFGREAPVKVCDLEDITTIVSDALPSERFLARCKAANVRVLSPEPETRR